MSDESGLTGAEINNERARALADAERELADAQRKLEEVLNRPITMTDNFQQSIFKKLEDIQQLSVFVEICSKAIYQAIKGVQQIDAWQGMAEVLGRKAIEPGDNLDKAKAHAGVLASFAELQQSNGNPYLYGLSSIRLWTLLEALIDELVVEAMKDPALCDKASLSKLKGSLIEFKSASPDEQAEFLADTLKQAVDAPLKLGIGRFEAILVPVRLGGSVDENVKLTLFELSQVRNCVVHKSGIADRRLIEACPWLNAERGKELRVTDAMFHRYMMAVYWYLFELRGRVDERNGEQRDAELVKGHLFIAQVLMELTQ